MKPEEDGELPDGRGKAMNSRSRTIAFAVVGLMIVVVGGWTGYQVVIELSKVRLFPFLLFGAVIVAAIAYWWLLRRSWPKRVIAARHVDGNES